MKVISKIRRGIVGSYKLTKFLFRRLKQIIAQHAEENTLHLPLAAGRFELGAMIEGIDSISLPHRDYSDRKIKVCILAGAYVFWVALETICRAFEQDPKYDVCILISEFDYDLTKPYLDKNFVHNRYCLEEEYDIEKENPDILLFSFYGTSPERVMHCMNHRHRFKLVIAVVGELITNMPDNLICNYLDRYKVYKPDYYIIDPLLYAFLKERQQISRTMIALNNAKYDDIYEGVYKVEYPFDVQWDKLRGKKTVLWATDHGVDNEVYYTVTFDLYARPFFDYAREHPNMGFILRLHPAFVQEMFQNEFWSLGDLARLKEYCRQSPNIVWDENATYNRAYSVADGIMTDGYCGIIVSALPLMKPLCACYRFDVDAEKAHKDYVRHLYQAHSIKEMYNFFDMVAAGEDPMYEERKEEKAKYMGEFDGKNGQRIKEFIERKFFEEVYV